jgi:Ankyrin repeats (many copies)
MTPNDDTRDEELLARYRRAGADSAGPSDAVREAILAESRRVAGELAKERQQQSITVSRPAANDSRWKTPVFGTAGAALLAALLLAPRYWQNAPPPRASMAPAPAPAAEPTPKLEEVKPYSPSNAATARESSSAANSPQEVVVTQAERKRSKSAGALSLDPPLPAPATPPSVAQNYAPGSSSANSLTAAPPASPLRPRPLGLSARADRARGSGVDNALQPATLQSAVAQGDAAQAASLLDQGAVIDARDEAGRTPLMIAVSQDRLEIVGLLLARGADPNAADNTGHTPLQQATKRNLRDIIALLEQAGAH